MFSKASLFLTVSAGLLLSHSSIVVGQFQKPSCMVCIASGLTWDPVQKVCNSVSSLKQPVDCYNQDQPPNAVYLTYIRPNSLLPLDIPNNVTNYDQELKTIIENSISKDLEIELQCNPGSQLKIYAFSKKAQDQFDQINFGCGKKLYLNARQTAYITFINFKDTEIASLIVDFGSKGLSIGAIIGIVVGSIAIIGIVVFLIHKKKNNRLNQRLTSQYEQLNNAK